MDSANETIEKFYPTLDRSATKSMVVLAALRRRSLRSLFPTCESAFEQEKAHPSHTLYEAGMAVDGWRGVVRFG